MIELETLPQGWELYALSEIVDLYDFERKPINNTERANRIANKQQKELYPYYGATGQVGWIDEYLSEGETVLLGEDAAPFLNPNKNKAYLVKSKFWVNNHAHVLRGLPNLVNNNFILHQLNYIDYHTHVTGSTRLKLTKSAMCKLPFLLCSHEEQTRIVDKLEELFSDLDSGIAELKTAQAKLKQYRHSLLKSAVEGSLTQQWRKENGDKIDETGEQLLARILIERRKHWESKKLAEFESKGKEPPRGWQDKYAKPVEPDDSELSTLPEGWAWASIDMIISHIEAGKSFKCLEQPPTANDFGIVKVSAVTWGEYNENESKTCLDETKNNTSILVKVGDFLFSRANTTELVGACVIAQKVTKNIMLSDKIWRINFISDALKYWVLQYLRGSHGRKQIEYSASGNQASMKNISQDKLKNFAIPIPSLTELQTVKNQLIAMFDTITKQSNDNAYLLKQAEAQRSNILKAAFSGQLVPQDPNDEPASVLLEKIKAEREALVAQNKAKKTKPKAPKKTKVKRQQEQPA